MKISLALVIAAGAIALIPASLSAAPAAKKAPAHKMAAHGKMGHTKMAAATKYECEKCHMIYGAADAKKAKFKCEMDGGKLVPVKPGAKTHAM